MAGVEFEGEQIDDSSEYVLVKSFMVAGRKITVHELGSILIHDESIKEVSVKETKKETKIKKQELSNFFYKQTLERDGVKAEYFRYKNGVRIIIFDEKLSKTLYLHDFFDPKTDKVSMLFSATFDKKQEIDELIFALKEIEEGK
jgi:hypothetical protein